MLGKITETLPGKPVQYALITHYHYDHSGGLWGYMTEGTTVVTTPGNSEFVYDIAAAPRTLKCERPLATKPDVELVTGKRTFGTGEQRVELYEVGPNPHVENSRGAGSRTRAHHPNPRPGSHRGDVLGISSIGQRRKLSTS